MKRVLLLLPLVVGCVQTEEVEVVKESNAPATTPKVIAPVSQPIKPVANEAIATPFQAQLVADSRWSKAENATVSVRLANHGTQKQAFTLRSGLAVDFVLSYQGEQVWRYSEQMMFTQALRTVTMDGGDERDFSVVIPAQDLTSLMPGKYQLSASFNVVESGLIPAIKPALIEVY